MITLQVDTKPLTKGLGLLTQRQIPFATAKALNATGLQAQEAQRSHLRRTYLLRRASFIERQGVKVTEGFARKDRLSITLGVDPKASFLDKFEAGGTKTPRPGGTSLAIPDEVRASERQVVPQRRRPRAFNFPSAPWAIGPLAAVYRTKQPAVIVRGKRKGEQTGRTQRLFMIRRFDKTGGIWERVGSGRHGRTRRLYVFLPKAPIAPDLRMARNVSRVAEERWAGNFVEALEGAVRTER